MLYRILRYIARIALRWFYRDVEIIGLERLPREGPLLVASNHPNALVDALVMSGARFVKTLRYNLKKSRPLACAVLPATRPQPTAMALWRMDCFAV